MFSGVKKGVGVETLELSVLIFSDPILGLQVLLGLPFLCLHGGFQVKACLVMLYLPRYHYDPVKNKQNK
jgi:hypothetical protein